MEVYFFPRVIIYFKWQFQTEIKPNDYKHEENIFKILHMWYYELLFFYCGYNLFLNVIKYDEAINLLLRIDCYCMRKVYTSTQVWANEREFLCFRKYNFAESNELY
jgi:hypothetical protein